MSEELGNKPNQTDEIVNPQSSASAENTDNSGNVNTDSQPAFNYQAPQVEVPQSLSVSSTVPQPNQQHSYTSGYYQYIPANSALVNAKNETDGFAVASLILSIVGILACCTFIPSLLGLIFGIISKANNNGTKPTGCSTAGIIISIVGIAFAVLFWIFMIINLYAYIYF